MIDTFVFADSGGTKTDWCVVTANQKKFFRTESYHPIYWNEVFESKIAKFWKEEVNLSKAKLYFFGAGCFNSENVRKGKKLFERIGFSNVKVASDVEGACYTLFGSKKGTGAILGTGSVMFDWSGSEVTKLIGGKGHLLGDEGSGYYFGKLMIHKWNQNEFSLKQVELLNEFSFSNYISMITKSNEKERVAGISRLVSEINSEFRDIHIENFQCFFDSHIEGRFKRKISVIGGYVSHNQDLFRGFLLGKGVELQKVINEPIAYIVERIMLLNE